MGRWREFSPSGLRFWSRDDEAPPPLSPAAGQRGARVPVSMSGVPPKVATVVLSWNGRDDTLSCLDALARASDGAPGKVIVVDNGSTDGTDAAVRAAHPWATVLQAGRNLGFSAGNNLGISAALEWGADFVFLINNDALVESGTVDRLVRTAVEQPATGAVSPLVLFTDPPDRVWFAGARFDPRRGRSGRVAGYRARLDELSGLDAPREIDRAVGAAMLVPCHVAERVGVFDPDLFFLYEDVDWSLRMRAAGLRIWLEPRARVRHRVAGSQNGRELTPTTLYYGTRNHLAVCSRHAPLSGWRAFARELAIIAVHLAAVRHTLGRREAAHSVLAGWRDWRAGRMGERGDTHASAASA